MACIRMKIRFILTCITCSRMKEIINEYWKEKRVFLKNLCLSIKNDFHKSNYT